MAEAAATGAPVEADLGLATGLAGCLFCILRRWEAADSVRMSVLNCKRKLGYIRQSPIVKGNWRDKLVLARNVKANQSDIFLIKASTGRMD